MSLPLGVKEIGGLGTPNVLVGYIVEGTDESALIETGPSNVVDEYIEKAALKVSPSTLHWALVSHIHIDHSGGAWKISERLHQIKVGVYTKGAKHLIDPSRLVPSAREALGKILEVWGEVRPVPESRIEVFEDGKTLDVGGKTLKLLAAPGHAPHSAVWYLEDSRTLFCGDALGIYIKTNDSDLIWPTTPPPSFDYELAQLTIGKIKGLKLDCICFPHFGYSTNIERTLSKIDEAFSSWFDLTDRAARNHLSPEQTLEWFLRADRYKHLANDPYRRELFLMDIKGMLIYQSKRLFDRTDYTK
jgi:glyoxylase-like metal-dependent hydrolase (beta-lactamase superfamily II)